MNILLFQSRSESSGKFTYNELNLSYDHCRYPQIFSRETFECVCPELLVKVGDECLCESCLLSTSEDTFLDKKSSNLPAYLNEFLKEYDQDEEPQFPQKDEPEEVSSRLLFSRGNFSSRKKLFLSNKKYKKISHSLHCHMDKESSFLAQVHAHKKKKKKKN